MSGKILGIGLSKTGTTSLAVAMAELGYQVAHFAEHRAAQLGVGTWFNGDFRPDCLSSEAALDLPIPVFFRELDQRYPGSRFILTTRNVQAWLRSIEAHWRAHPTDQDERGEYRRMVRRAAFGTCRFSAERMKSAFDDHERAVRNYFRDRPTDLLIMDLDAGDGWDPLCRFLQRPPVTSPFPHHNRAARSATRGSTAAGKFTRTG